MVKGYNLSIFCLVLASVGFAQPTLDGARTTSLTNVEVDFSVPISVTNGGGGDFTITGLTITAAVAAGDKVNLTINPPIVTPSFSCASCLTIAAGAVTGGGGNAAINSQPITDGIAPAAPPVPTATAGPDINAAEELAGFDVRASITGIGAVVGDQLDLLLGGAAFGSPLNKVLVAGDITDGYVDFTIATGQLTGGDGIKNITSRLTDAAGNAGASSPPLALNLDTTPPTINIVGPSASLANNGSMVTYTINYTGGSAVTLANGNITINQTGGAGASHNVTGAGPTTRTVTLTSFTGNGTVGISIAAGTATDAAGNPAAAAGPSSLITVDNMAPGPPPTPSNTLGSTINASENGLFSVIVGSLVGTNAVAMDVLEILVDGSPFIPARTQVLSAGQATSGFTFTNVTLPGPDGVKNITARITDQAGNVGAPSVVPLALTRDVTAPNAPSTPTAALGPLINAAENSNFNISVPNINTTGAVIGDVLEIFVNGGSFGPALTRTLLVGDISVAGYTFMNVTLPGGDGLKNITARITDQAGNPSSTSPQLGLTLDTTPPTINIVGPSVSIANNAAVVTYTINYTGATAVTLANGNITINSTGGAGASHNVTGAGVSTRTVTLTSFTGDGTVGISIASGTATDVAGNTAPAAGPSSTITVDNTPPAAPGTPNLQNGSDSGIANNDNITNDLTPTFDVGSTTSGATVQILSSVDGGVRGSAVSSGGTTAVNATLVTQGNGQTHSITARQVDAAGNVGPSSAALVITLDTTPPQIAGTTWSANGGGSNRERVTVTFDETLGIPNNQDLAQSDEDEPNRDGFYVSFDESPSPTINNEFRDGETEYKSTGNEIRLTSVSDGNWPSSGMVFRYNNTSLNPTNAANNHPNYVYDVAGNELATVTFSASDLEPPVVSSGFVLYPNGNSPETIVFKVSETITQGPNPIGFFVNGVAALASYDIPSATVTLTSPVDNTWNNSAMVSYTPGNVTDGVNPMVAFPNTPIRLQNIFVSSNNANGFTQRAALGDVVTVDFVTSTAPTPTPTVILDNDMGTPAVVTGAHPNWSATYTITGANNDGVLPLLVYMLTATDSTGTNSTTLPLPVSSSITVDKTIPIITPVTIASNNANPAFGIPGNIVTISFSVNEPLFGSPVVTLDGKPTLVAGGPLAWTATATLDGTYTEGAPLTFNIALQDEVGNPAVATATTNASSVTFDNTPPTVSMIDISSGLNGIGATNGYTPPPNTVSFLVTFSEPNVSGVDASDFQIVTGNFGGDISFPLVSATGLPPITVSAVTGSTATVTLNGITGTGWIRINLIDNNTIRDPAGNLLGGPVLGAGTFITSFTGNDYYTVALPEPSNPVINPLVARFSTNFGVAWNDGGGAQLATNYLVIVKRTSVPSFPAINDGTFVPDDGNLADGILIQNVPFGTTSHLFTGVGLVDNFDAIIYPYTLSPNNTNDNINFGTPVSVYSSADIRKNPGFNYSGTVNIPYINHQATDIINSGTSIVLEEFELRDGAGAADPDNLPTELTALTLEVTNYQNLRQIALFDGGTQIKELPASSIINTGPSIGQVTFSSFDNPFVAADDGNQTLSIRVSFLGNGVTDNDIITFRVVNVTAASTNSSQFLNTTPVGIQSTPTGDQNKIEVTATKLDYVSIPLGGTSAFISANFNVIVHARDAAPFDNLDLDFNGNVSSITNAGTLLTSPTPATSGAFAAGVKNFTFQYLTEGNGTLTMSTTGPTISSQVSPPINVVASSESRLYTDNSGLLPTIDYINHQQASNPNTYTLARLILSDGDADGFPGDSDLAPTVLTDLDINISNPTFIKRIALYNAAGTLIGGTDQNGGAGTISFSGLSITAPDDGSTFFTIRASFENSTVIDETNIQVTVTAATEGVGSNFLPGGGLIGGVDVASRQTPAVGANIVDVVATRLDFTTQPDAISGVDEPFMDFPPVPVVQARDVHQRLDLGHDFVATLGTGGASLNGNVFPFVDGVLTLSNVEYGSTGNGTLSVASNGLSSTTGGSIPGATVDVLDVTATLATGGVVTSTNLAGGSVDRVIFGVTFTAPYQVGGSPDLSSFKISFGNTGATDPIDGILENIRVFRNSAPAFGGPNITSFGGSATFDPNGSDLNISFSTPEDLSTPKSYFLQVDIVSSASGTTPALTPSVIDGGYASATAMNVVTTAGSATANVLGKTYNFSAIFPPTLDSSYPASGQINVSPDQDELRLTFSVPVWSLDQQVRLHDQTAGTFVDLVATNGLLGVDGMGIPDPATLANPLIFVHPVNPTLSLIPDHLYYVTIASGNYEGPFNPVNTGVRDQAGNLFPGISFNGTLFFKAASPNPPNLLNTPTAPVSPSISNVSVSGATISGAFDQPGRAYFLVLPTGTPAPSGAQVRADVIHPSRLAQGSFAINQSTPVAQAGNIIPLSGSFTAGTTYDVWMSAESYSELNSVLTPIPATPPSPFGNAATVAKSGTITASLATNTVTGVGTAFTTELVPGRTLFDNTGTQVIGTIATIESDNSLTLVIEAINAITGGSFRASGFEIGGPGPTLQFTPPAPSSGLTVNNPSTTICAGAFQILPDPIVITESSSRNEFSGTPGADQVFNLVLPSGFIFDTSIDGLGQPNFGTLTLVGSDFTAGGSPSLSFVGNSILRVSFRNNGSASLDNLIIAGLRVLAASPISGTIKRFSGDAILPELGELSDVATLTAINAPGIPFANSYSIETFGNTVVNTIPNNFSDPNLNQPLSAELIPLPPFGDYGPSTFSGPGVNINLLNLTAVTLNTPFNVTINHVDNNGCPSQTFEQYTVYDSETAIADLLTEYCTVNSNFTIANPTALADVGVNTHIITFDRLQSFYLDDLEADVPQTATASDIIFGPAWQNVLENFFIAQIGSGVDPANNPISPNLYFNYQIDEATILNAKSIDPTIPQNPYDYFIQTSPQDNTYYNGGSLGLVQFTGTYQSIANASVQIPLLQNVEFFVPPVPIIEFELTNSSVDTFDPGNPIAIFCDATGDIAIGGFPAASAGSSVGRFTVYDHVSNTVIFDGVTPVAGFLDNTNGTGTLNPLLLNNNFQTIRIEYTYKDNASPCEATATRLLRISPTPVASFTAQNLCENGMGTMFTDESTITVPFVISDWAWNFADGNSTTNTSTSQNPTHVYTQAGSYFGVELTVRSPENCFSTPYAEDILIGSTPNVVFDFSGVSIAEQMTFLSADTDIPVDDPVEYNLVWDFGDGAAPEPQTGRAPKTKTYVAPGIYKVTLDVTSGKGCNAVLEKDVVMVDKFTPTDLVAYQETFETSDGNWQVLKESGHPSTASWEWGAPDATIINTSLNGANVWTTNLTGPHNPGERSYLYTTCFDMTQLERPMISFNSFVQLGTGDGVVIEYSTDNRNIADPAKSWNLLGDFEASVPSGVDWYNALGLPSKPGDQITGDFGWSGSNITEWLESKHILDEIDDPATPGGPLTPINNVVFRFGIASLTQNPQRDGFAMDNIRIGNRTRTVLVENFTNKGNPTAGPGGQSREKFESDRLKNLNPGEIGTELVKINYHVGFPGSDPFNLDNPADPSSRALYYNITETPFARLDGSRNQGLNEDFFSSWFEDQYAIRTLQLAQADLLVNTSENADGSLQVDVSVDPKVELGANTILHVAVVEKSIASSALSATQQDLIQTGETDFEYVLKRMLPTALGTRFGAVAPAGQILNFGPFNWYPDKVKLYSPANDLAVIVFLQDEDTREILQSEIIEDINDPPLVTGLDFESIADRIAVFPNPADGEVTVQLPTPAVNRIELQMVDQMGRVVNRSAIEVGEQSKEVYTREMAGGIYLLQFGSGNSNTFKKIMVVHK